MPPIELGSVQLLSALGNGNVVSAVILRVSQLVMIDRARPPWLRPALTLSRQKSDHRSGLHYTSPALSGGVPSYAGFARSPAGDRKNVQIFNIGCWSIGGVGHLKRDFSGSGVKSNRGKTVTGGNTFIARCWLITVTSIKSRSYTDLRYLNDHAKPSSGFSLGVSFNHFGYIESNGGVSSHYPCFIK